MICTHILRIEAPLVHVRRISTVSVLTHRDDWVPEHSTIDGLAARSESSSFALKGKPQNARDAGRKLEADYLVEGSVLRSGQQLRVNVQLVRVSDDFPLWSGRYDRESTDIFAIQDEISRGIVNNLRLKFGRGRRRYETSTEAYNLYLRARALRSRLGFAALRQGIALFEQAIAKDPSFAPAYAGPAQAHALLSGNANLDIPQELEKLHAAADLSSDCIRLSFTQFATARPSTVLWTSVER